MNDITAYQLNAFIQEKRLFDAIYSGIPVIEALKKRATKQRGMPASAKAYREISGGEKIQDSPLLSGSSTGIRLGAGSVYNVAGHDPAVTIEWPWGGLGDVLLIEKTDEARNTGSGKLADLVQQRLREKMDYLGDLLETDIFGSSTTGTSGWNGVNGFGAMFSTTPTTGTWAGVNRASYTGWQNQYTASIGDVTPAGAGQAALIALFAACKASTGKEWDYIFAGEDAWSYIGQAAMEVGRTYFQRMDDPDLGFPSFGFMGAKVILAPKLSGNTDALYGINTEALVFAVNKNMNFKVDGPIRALDQPVRGYQIDVMAQLFPRRLDGMALGDGVSNS